MASIVVGTNSYVTVAELETYAIDRGITIAATDKSVLLIKAMDFMEVQKYKGYKTVSTQALQFPRVLCSTGSSNYCGYVPCEYDSETVPTEIGTAQLVAALLIDSGEDIQANSTQAIKREKVDVIEIEYQDNTNGSVVYTQLNSLIAPFLANQGLRTQRV
jgi:hypothetical protein